VQAKAGVGGSILRIRDSDFAIQKGGRAVDKDSEQQLEKQKMNNPIADNGEHQRD
jgi:hypothetical protein